MPKRILLLTKLLIKGGDFSFGSGGAIGKRRKKLQNNSGIGRKIGMTILYIFLALYVGGFSFFLGRSMTLAAVQMNSAAGIPEIIVPGICISAVVFGFVYVVTAFYHTNNTEILLSMPFRPSEIIAGRYLQVMSYEYMTLGGFFLPFLVAFGIYSNQGPLFYIAMLLTLIFLPFLALALMTILIMVLMRFTKFFKNKDRFTVISTILIMLVAFGISFSFNMSMNPNLNSGGLPTISQATVDNAGKINFLFLGADFATKWLTQSNTLSGWLYGLLFIAATAAWTALLLFVASKVYFKGVMSAGSSTSRQQKLNSREEAALARSTGRFRNFVNKEFRILMRTPAFFSNNVLMCFLMPILFLVPTYFGFTRSGMSMAQLRESVAGLASNEQTFASVGGIVLIVTVGLILFLSGTNGIAAGAISREGSAAYLMKIYPYPFSKQMLAKYLVAVLFSLVTPVILVSAIQIVLNLPMKLFLPLCVLVFLCVLLVNLLGLMADMALPKINWANEQQAAKQNYNMLIEMFGSLILAGVAIAAMLLAGSLSEGNFYVIFIVGCLALLLQAAILTLIIVKMSARTLRLITE